MRRAAHIAAWIGGVLIGLPVLGVIMLIIAGNTDAGRHAIETLTAKLSGGAVRLQGLGGSFPDALRLAHGEIRDRDGTWLSLDDVALDWSPSHLLLGEATIDRLTAADVAVARLPVSESKTSAKSSNSNLLPLRVSLDTLRIDKLELGAALAGVPAVAEVEGSLHLASLTDGDVALAVTRLDGPGRYTLTGKIAAAGDHMRLDVSEPAQGLIGELAGLPDLGALSLRATLDGPRNAERLGLSARAGALRADGQGTIDVDGQTLQLDLTGNAPAMAPRPDVSWQSVAVDLHVHGGFTTPDATGKVAIAGLDAGGARIGRLTADLQGDSGKVDLTAAIDQVHLPDAQPDLLAAAPIAVRAEAILNTPTRPVTFTITHPLLALSGTAQTSGEFTATIDATLPDLAPLAALGGADVQGKATLTAKLARRNDGNQLALDGKIDVTGGEAIAAKLLGPSATLSLQAHAQGDDATLDRMALDGRALRVTAHGALTNGTLAADWGATLANVADLGTSLSGPLSIEGKLTGPQDDLALTMTSHGQIAAPGVPAGALDASITASGLPAHPAGEIDLRGTLAGAPIALTATMKRGTDGTAQFTLGRAQWKSLTAQADLTLPAGAVFPIGRLQLRMSRLADLAPLLGTPVAGSIDATLDTVDAGGTSQAKLHAESKQLAGFGDSADRVTLDATIKDPAAHPAVAARLALDGIAAPGVTGKAVLDANSTADVLALKLAADLVAAQGAAHITAAATGNLPQRALQVTALRADYAGEAIRLLGPARLRMADGIAIDQLRIGTGVTVLSVAGRIAPALQLTVALRNATPALAKPFAPDLTGSGSLSLDAKLAGTMAAPTGSIHVIGRDLTIQNGAGAAMPAATIDATATLEGKAARIDAKISAGANAQLRLAGLVPLDPAAPVDLQASGNVDLMLLDPLLTAEGRSVHGQMTLALAITGTIAAPRVNGRVKLANGSVQDYVQGIHITAINGIIDAAGDTLRLTQLNARAGVGTMTVSGTVSVSAPGMPINLAITARNAKPLASDLLNATLDADLTLTGEIEGALALGGRIHVSNANLQIPDSFPQSVAVLKVRRPGQKEAPPPPAQPITLALIIDAPEQIFVRGHGLDAEMGGTLKLSGNSNAPQIDGGFDLRHGTFSLAGQTLNFTSGRVAFDGFGLSSKLDPTLNFVAQSTANSITATLTVSGYADAPKIALSSSPALPQDEILAQLLFGQSVKQLSPFQVVEIAQAVAAISGLGAASDPLAGVRKGLGLDRLSVGAAAGNGPGATVEAGKYVANGVYVGTKQGTAGGTQAQVQVDLTKHLKLESTLGTGGTPATGVTPDNDPGSSIGLTYQFEY
jgi:translocation and assembly module TamB